MAQSQIDPRPDARTLKSPTDQIAEAFSRKAPVYEALAQDHPNLTRMRAQVYRHLASCIRPPARILELNAGTGIDAVALVRLGYRVHATDIAPGMLDRIRAKIEHEGLQEQLSVQQCSFDALDSIESGPFDCIFSDLGGLNCTNDLRAAADQLPRLLEKGGIVTWVIMPPICLWDFAGLFKGDRQLATRRLRKRGVRANIEGIGVMTYYYSPAEVAAAFDARFKVERIEGLSIFAPPADRKRFAVRFPRLYQFLVGLDGRISTRPPFRGWGDFFIMTLRYC